MSSGLYNTHKIDFDTTLDLTRLKPYGDTMNGVWIASVIMPSRHSF